MLIMDNWSLNVVSKVNEFWIKNHIRILTIAPYCSSLNLIEKLILSIKSKISLYLSECKNFNLKLLQNSIDKKATWDLSDFVRASNKEVLCKMKDLAKNYLKMKKLKLINSLINFHILKWTLMYFWLQIN